MMASAIANLEVVAPLSRAISDDLTLLSTLQATELDASGLAELKRLGFPDGLGLCLRTDKAREVLAHLNKVVKQWPDRVDSACLDDLASDFAAIYLNAQIGASPHESFWLDEEHLVMQKPMFEVRDYYREHGLKVQDWRSRADDHIVNELSFLSEIMKAEPDHANLSIAAGFLDEHLLRWIGEFADRVAGHSGSELYSGLVLLTAIYCEELRDLLALILNEPRPDPEALDARLRARSAEPVKVAPPQFSAGPGW